VVLVGSSRDDSHAATAATIPWTFSFFGTPQTQFWASTNGFIQFGATAPGNPVGGDGSIPSATAGPLVGLFWDDLLLRAAPTSDICYATVGAAPERRVIIEWLDALRYNVAATHITAEIILNERNSVIELIYSRLEAPTDSAALVDGTGAAIGLQNANGTLSVVHVGGVATTAGIRYTPL
jgi:hypothetical protein